MPAILILALSMVHLVAYTEAAVILLLLLLGLRLCEVSAMRARQRNRARRERDEARANLETLRRMSEIRLEVVTRLRGFSR